MILESIAGTVLGGLFRLAPEVLNHRDKKDERKAEIERLKLEAQIAQQQGELKMRADFQAGQIGVDLKNMDAMIEAVKGQSVKTGIGWVDAISTTVRPFVTYWLITLYSLAKFAQFSIAAKSGDWQQAVLLCWTENDASMLASVISFWFLDRSLSKRK